MDQGDGPTLSQSGDGFFVGDVSGNKNDAGGEIGAMLRDPGMNLSAVDAAGSAHVGHNALKLTVL